MTNKLIQLKDKSGNMLYPQMAIDITNEFRSDFTIQTLRVIYYADIKKVEAAFYINNIFSENGWIPAFRTNNSKYFSNSAIYSTCYSSANRQTGIVVDTDGTLKFFKSDSNYDMSSGIIYWFVK